LHLCEVFFRVKIQMVDKKVCFLVYLKFISLWDCYLNMNCLETVVNIGAWIRSCANTAVLALPEVETPYLAHNFFMPGIWKPVFVFIQRKFVTFYSKVCNKIELYFASRLISTLCAVDWSDTGLDICWGV